MKGFKDSADTFLFQTAQDSRGPKDLTLTFTSLLVHTCAISELGTCKQNLKSFSWPEVLMWCFGTASSRISQGQQGFKETLAGVTCASNMGEKVESDGQMAYFKMIILSVF